MTRQTMATEPRTRGRLEGQVAVITGAGSGIGQGIALRFAAEGACVVVACRSTGGQETVDRVARAGGRALWVPTDVGDAEQVRGMIDRTLDAYGQIDILVNNAAVQYLYRLWELPDELFDTMLRTNLRGYFLCAKHAIPHMIGRGRGCIINISSNLAFRALPEFAGYSATKGGIVAMSRALALDAAPFGIRVNCICPGSTITPIMDPILATFDDPQAVLDAAGKAMPAGRLGLPDDIAGLALFLASEEACWIVGATFVIDGGASIKLQS